MDILQLIDCWKNDSERKRLVKMAERKKSGAAYVSPIKTSFEVGSLKFRFLLLVAALIPWKHTLNITINKGAVFLNPPNENNN